MKLKEIYRIYKDYNIEVFGKPLDTPTIPFTFLPKVKDIKECKVIDYKIIREIIPTHTYEFVGDEIITTTEYKSGYVMVYIK